jgi:NADH:ubiquinone oxidoreductase subunit 2 (subunit N)
MAEHAFLLTTIAIVAPWVAAVLAAFAGRHVRGIGFSAAFVSLAASVLLLESTPATDSLDAVLMILFSSLTLGAMLVLPRRDCDRRTIAGTLFLLGSTLLTYAADNLLVLFAGWILAITPFLMPSLFRARSWRPQVSSSCFDCCRGFRYRGDCDQRGTAEHYALKGQKPGGMAAFALLVIAVMFRKGICPAHAWVADAAEGGPLISTALLLNAHLGAFVVAKLILSLFPDTVRTLFPLLSYLALATALYVAIRALMENAPRRLLAFLALSQSACILAGLESRTTEGITGALVRWMVVSASTVGLLVSCDY